MTPVLISDMAETDRQALLESLKTLIDEQVGSAGSETRNGFTMVIESDHRLKTGEMLYLRTVVVVRKEEPNMVHARSTIMEVKRYRDLAECLAFQVTRDVDKHRN